MADDREARAPRRAWRRKTLRAAVVLAAIAVMAVAVGLSLPDL